MSHSCSTADPVHQNHTESVSRCLQTATQQDPRTAIAAGELFRVWWYSAVRMWSQLALPAPGQTHRAARNIDIAEVWYYICLFISRLTVICCGILEMRDDAGLSIVGAWRWAI
jgi:hypothetical protein